MSAPRAGTGSGRTYRLTPEGHLWRFSAERPDPDPNHVGRTIREDFGTVPGGAYVAIARMETQLGEALHLQLVRDAWWLMSEPSLRLAYGDDNPYPPVAEAAPPGESTPIVLDTEPRIPVSLTIDSVAEPVFEIDDVESPPPPLDADGLILSGSCPACHTVAGYANKMGCGYGDAKGLRLYANVEERGA